MATKKKEPSKVKESAKATVPPDGSGSAEDFEKLGVFYLGRPYDLATKQSKPEWLLYDSKDLVTHAVCVGMTGSGKTGLCIGLLEEAAIDGIPALIIDPKGDLANLMLTFPQLRGEDFEPWVNEDDARKKGLSPADYAKGQAELWKKGLSDWGQNGERIQKLKDAADFVIYTPGSNAGVPISILKAFAAPPREIIEDVELLREQISTTVTSLLGLVGVFADPINSPPHILLSTIVESAWKRGQDLDLIPLIQQVQTPPFDRLGALDLESFYPKQDPTHRDDPSKGRFSLTKRLNNLIASPSFESWMEGEPLDLDSMLHTSEGKPRIAIVSIAHLTDVERMFFVSLLLTQTLSWMRKQSGTTSLRAILYMDEIFGYFPPVANPPSKQPLLTLLKQARAFGLGVVLATQNPVDLDYKGLANTGTWFIGRLQTERDKARVLEGLEGATASSGTKFNRQKMEEILAGLGNRVFLMNNVHEDAPVIFHTRWTLSYLRGPLTRNQIKTLMELRKPAIASALVAPAADRKSSSATSGSQRSILPPDVPQYFIPLRGSQPAATHLLYRPMLLGSAQVRVADAKAGIDVTEECTFLTPMMDSPVPIDWDDARKADIAVSDLEKNPQGQAEYMGLPEASSRGKNYELWSKDFAGWLYRTHKVELLKSRSLKEISKPGESERDFRLRLQQSGREQRDKQLNSLRQKYAPKIAVLQDRIRRAEQMKEKQRTEARSSQVQAAISVGASILGAFLGRKTISATNIGRATTAIRSAGRVMKESQEVGQAEENVADLQRKLAELEAQFKSESEALAAATDPLNEKLETISINPIKANIVVKLVALAWTPNWRNTKGTSTPALM
jgi:hypothetical protein